MRANNVLKTLLALAMAVLMLFSFTACFDDSGDNKEIVGSNGDASNQGSDNGGSESEQNATIQETVCFEYDGFKVTAKEIINDSIWGAGIKLYIENNGNKDYSLSTNAVIVNNCMVSSFSGSTVAAGKKANETLYLSSSDLEAAGITNIGQIEIYFYLYDPNSYDTIYTADCVTLKTSAYSSMDTTPDESGHVLYNQGGIKIIGKYVDESTFWGSSVLLYVQNSTGRNIGISSEDMSINGFMVSGYYYADIYAGKYSLDEITIMSSDLTENGITSIDEIELKFHIYDSDSYETIADTDPIKFKAK